MRRINNQWELGRAGEDFFWHFGGLRDNIEMIERYSTREQQEVCGDFRVSIDGEERNVDAKVELVLSVNFVVELKQDQSTGNVGWFHKLTQCNEIWIAQANIDELAPFGLAFWSIWRISLARLRQIFHERHEQWRDMDTSRGWGHTIAKLVPYQELIDSNAAIHWWGLRYDGPFVVTSKYTT